MIILLATLYEAFIELVLFEKEEHVVFVDFVALSVSYHTLNFFLKLYFFYFQTLVIFLSALQSLNLGLDPLSADQIAL